MIDLAGQAQPSQGSEPFDLMAGLLTECLVDFRASPVVHRSPTTARGRDVISSFNRQIELLATALGDSILRGQMRPARDTARARGRFNRSGRDATPDI